MENGFVHTSQHLPSNAKGVLFLIDGPPSGYQLRSGKHKGVQFLPEVGPALSDKDFFIEERDTGRKLKASVTRLPLEKSLGQPQPNYFAAKTPGLARCIAENLFSLDGCGEIETQSDQLIAKDELYDAAQEVNKAYGLFRISPTDGFIPGKEYVVRYSGSLKNHIGVNYLRATTVMIDKTPWNPLAKRAARLAIDKSVVKFNIPPVILPYQDYLYTYTLLSLDGGTLPYVPLLQVTQQERARTPIACGDCTNYHPAWKERRQLRSEYSIEYHTLKGDISKRPCHKAKGLLGFLEVEDTLSELQELRVNCP